MPAFDSLPLDPEALRLCRIDADLHRVGMPLRRRALALRCLGAGDRRAFVHLCHAWASRRRRWWATAARALASAAGE